MQGVFMLFAKNIFAFFHGFFVQNDEGKSTLSRPLAKMTGLCYNKGEKPGRRRAMGLYTELKTAFDAGRQILCYGMGDGADKLHAVLQSRGIAVADVFASDGFVRGQLFRGKRVLSRSEALQKYPDPIVLVAFGSSLPDVIETVESLTKTCELRIPDLPVSADEDGTLTVFDEAFCAAHRDELAAARALLSDEYSRALFDDIVEYRLTGRPEPLFRRTYEGNEAFTALFDYPRYRAALDLGAYTGDTARELFALCPRLEKIIALEPDPRSFKKLAACAEGEPRLTALPAAAWSRNEPLLFAAKGNRNSAAGSAGSGAKTLEIPGLTPDEAAGHTPIDYIKYDVEGAEEKALRGSAGLLARRPDLRIALYHRARDLFALPLLVNELMPGAELYLRRKKGFPAWDLELFVKGGN